MSARLTTALVAVICGLALTACGSDDSGDGGTQPEGTLLGFNEVITTDGDGLPIIAASGASFVRVAINWTSAEPEPGQLVWGGPDAINAALAEQGLRPLWVVTSAPCWAAAQECDRPQPGLSPKPESVKAYASFVAAVAERYPDSLGIEIWNEPNLPQFWRPTPEPELYRELLSEAADAVHDGGTDVAVVMGAPSPVSAEEAARKPEKIEFTVFTELVMSGEDRPDVDAIGAHPYSLLFPDEDPVAATLRLFEEARAAAEQAAPGIPIWVTETGLTTAGKSAVSPEEQAKGLSEIFTTFADAGVPVITVHRFFDQEDPIFPFEAGFGVVEEDRETPKPSFCALAEAAGSVCEEPGEGA